MIKQNEFEFYFKIASCFELLFEEGLPEPSLTRRFINSDFRKLVLGEQIYILGKLFDRDEETPIKEDTSLLDAQKFANNSLKLPKVIVLGRPALKYKFVQALGKNSEFLANVECDEFGFELLFCDAQTGGAHRFCR